MSNETRRLGRILKSARVLSGLTQSEVGQRVGLSAGFISMTERGERVPSPATLAKVLRVIAAGADPSPERE